MAHYGDQKEILRVYTLCATKPVKPTWNDGTNMQNVILVDIRTGDDVRDELSIRIVLA